MSHEKNTGGPAFPHPDYIAQGWEGMTLQDYFAAYERSFPTPDFVEAFADRIIGPTLTGGRRPLTGTEKMELHAEWRYACADAMLKARAK